MRVAIVYNQPGQCGDAADDDVLVQKDSIVQALSCLGHESIEIPCTLDFEALRRRLAIERPDCVFNLVEALGGTDKLSCIAPLLLESFALPYTGSAGHVMLQTADKVAVKRQLRALGLPTPDWMALSEPLALIPVDRYIVKARYEHASVGMDDEAVIRVSDSKELLDAIEARSMATGFEMFAERFIDGREFNVAVIANAVGEPQVLSPAEIDFSAFPESKPRIVGYAAKWDEASFEFSATPRRFEFPAQDIALLTQLARLSEDVWKAFELCGYARVDFRVDGAGHPFILEINTNPCLSPDAGFSAALEDTGIAFETAISLIVGNAMRGGIATYGTSEQCLFPP